MSPFDSTTTLIAMINKYTDSEVSSFTRAKDAKGGLNVPNIYRFGG